MTPGSRRGAVGRGPRTRSRTGRIGPSCDHPTVDGDGNPLPFADGDADDQRGAQLGVARGASVARPARDDVVDEATAAAVAGRQALGTGWVSHLLQQAVATLWADPAVHTVLERATATYVRRRTALRDALAAEGIVAGGRSGLTTWVPVPDDAGVTAGLLAAGWAVVPGERFRLVSQPGIRIDHGTLEPPEAIALAGDLGRLLRQRRVRPD